MNNVKKIVIVAGDKSGDAYGGRFCRGIKEKMPGAEIYSFGGECLKRHSTRAVNLLQHSVTGIFEVFSSLKNLLAAFKQIVATIKNINPDLVILIDFPDFNLRLARKLNKKYPLFYYISPQIWAWRKNRINTIKKYVDKMVVIFKFEKEFYQKHGIDALYFGHPLLENIEKNSTDPEKIISFLPGSRRNEIARHLPIMQKAKTIMQKRLPSWRFQIIRPPNIAKEFYQKFNIDIEIKDYSMPALQSSRLIVAASGTATVEAALMNIPHIIVCKLNPLTWHIARRMVDVKFVGMINILAGKEIIKELLQNEVTPENITAQSLKIIENETAYRETKDQLRKASTLLEPRGASEKTAAFICEYLDAGNKAN